MRRYRVRAFALLLLMTAGLGVLEATAQSGKPAGVPLDPAKAVTQYVHTVWQTEQGLPQNSVRVIRQTRDGYLWLGTQEGLVRFDGVRFRVFDKNNTPDLRHNYVWSLLEDNEGRLWIGTVGGGLSRFADGRFIAYGAKDGLANEYVRALHQSRDGSVWIGTDGGLFRFDDGGFTGFTAKDGLTNDHVRAIQQDRQGILWIGTDGGGLLRYEGGRFTTLTTRDGLVGDRVSSICEDRDGGLWIGTQGGLSRLKDGAFTSFTVKHGLASDIVMTVHPDREGTLWVGTNGGGISRRNKDRTFSTFTTKEGLSNDSVSSITQDREGTLWIGTDGGGLNRLENGTFTTFAAREGLSSDVALAVQEDREGAVWVGTHGGGLNRLKDGKATALTTRNGLASDVVFALHEARDGSLWIGTDAGLDRLFRLKLTHFGKKDGLSSDRIRALLEDRNGNLWVGTDGGGLNRLAAGKVTVFTTRDGLSNDIVTSIHEDREGALWIGTEGGLNRLQDGRLSRFTTRNGLSNDFVFSIHEDADGVLWIGTFGGLNRFQGGRFTVYTTRQGLFDDLVAKILEDGLGNFWLSSNRGISRVRKADLDLLAAGKLEKVRFVSYGAADGMRSRECNGGFQPAGWKARDGRLWFPTVRGVVVVDPAHMPVNDVPPSVLVENVLVDGQAMGGAGPLIIPPGRPRLEFSYTATSLRAPEKVRFKYMLEGQDSDRVDAGTRRVAYYTNVPHGPHTFRVMASNDDGVWSQTEAGFAFRQEPRLQETWWFYLVSALALAAVLGGVYRVRVRHLMRREQELLVLVEERTKDLREAQETISRLLASSPGASESIPAWSRSLADEIAGAVGVERIGLWEVDHDTFSPLSDSGLRVPSVAELRGLVSAEGQSFVDWEDGTIIPMTGTSGELCGALAISGRSRAWGETERRLLAGLAHQLAGALEMSRMRRQLAAAEERQAATRREMHASGIATLQICPACGRCYDHTVTSCPDEGSRLDAPRLLPYLLLGRYRCLHVLGQGGMGMVLAAHDEKLDRDVAIKLIRPEHFGRPDLKERFAREARTVARVHHEGVIALHDSGELEDGTAFLVMEKLRGCDLALLLRAYGPGQPHQVASLVQQGCSALGAAHRAGVVHRDIKPENIFLVDDPGGFRVKVLDFGLAKSMTLDKGLTQTGMVVGTPRYMSPEQVRGEESDARSDVYSFAAVCYEALVGQKVVAGDDLGQILINVLHTDPTPVSSLLPGIPPEVDAAFECSLAKNRAWRLADIEHWGASLVEILETATAGTTATGWPEAHDALARLGDQAGRAEGRSDLRNAATAERTR